MSSAPEALAEPTLSAGVSPGQRQGRALHSAGAAMAPLRGWAARDRPGPAAFPAPRRAPPRPPSPGDPAAAPGLRPASSARSNDHSRRPGRPARGVSGGGRLRARAIRGGYCGASQEEPRDRTAAPAAAQPAPRCLPGTLAKAGSLGPNFISFLMECVSFGWAFLESPLLTDKETEV